jgi:hypothetical protein
MAARVAVLLLCICAAGRGGLFDIDRVGEVRLEFSQPNWDELLDSLYAAGEEGRLVGTAWVNGARFDSVGVRYKGNSSYNPSRRKNPFNVKLDEVVTGQTIEGHGTLRLANVYKDPSFVREALSYEIARRYMPAGRANYVNVFVNDTLIGLYNNDEDPDPEFMRRHFFGDGNARFKGRLTDSTRQGGWQYFGTDSAPYLPYYELESDSGWRELIGFLDTLNNHNELLDRVLNVDRHLWLLAFDALMVNLDAPINMPQNYYLYRDPARRFNPIVWDLNENFGAFRDLLGTGQLSVAQMQQLDPFLRSTDTLYPIASRVLNDARRRRMYVAHMKTVIAETFANNWYRDRALELQDIIDADVAADRNKFYTYNDFLNNVTRSVGTGPLAIVGLAELMGVRSSWLLTRPEFAAAAPVVSAVGASPDRPAPGSEVRFTAQVDGADSVFLGWRADPAAAFRRVAMADAGGGSFAATLRVGAGNIEYYVYAENSEAGTFEPARAEHEFLSLPVAGDVVINELMAMNRHTVRDPSGEYDDWVELYNGSAQAVSLDGWLLSNDTTDITRWSFPDVAIAPGAYLIVWADSDSGQAGLHANFELAGSSGTLLLCDEDGHPVDRATWGQQCEDVSFGRWPNGRGAFRPMNPTFGADNDSTVGVAEPAPVAELGPTLSAWPNPVVTSTRVRFSLPGRARATLRVFDAAGRAVATLVDGELAAGSHEVSFAVPGAAQPGGVYFARLTVQGADGAARTDGAKLVRAR